MAYSLDVANNTISNMGYKGIDEGDDQGNQQAMDDSNLMTSDRIGLADPIVEFEKDEMVRLCRTYEEEVGIMYPVIDIPAVISHAKSLSSVIESMRNQRSSQVLNDEKTLLLKTVMCCGLVVEEHGHSDKAVRLYESMEAVINRKLMSDSSDVESLPLLGVVAGYRLLSCDEVVAWRVMGQVQRLCLELGIHRYTGLMTIKNEQARRDALNLFWSAYVLERRWAFSTGLPYAVHDDEIDPHLPLPVSIEAFLASQMNSR